MNSIRVKMLLWFGLALLFLLSTLGLVTYHQTKATGVPLTEELSQEVLRARSAEMARLMQGYINDIKTMSRRNLIRSGNFNEIKADLGRRAHLINADYEMLFYADARGRYVTTTGAEGDVSDREYFRAIMLEGREELVSEPIVSRASGGYDGLERIARKMTAGESGVLSFRQPDGSMLMTIFGPIANTPDWSLGISLHEGELMGKAIRLMRVIAFLMVAILIAVLLVVFFISGRITSPLLALKKGVQIVSSGNLNHSLDIRTGDEIEELAHSFNKMTGDLKDTSATCSRSPLKWNVLKGSCGWPTEFKPACCRARFRLTRISNPWIFMPLWSRRDRIHLCRAQPAAYLSQWTRFRLPGCSQKLGAGRAERL